MRKEVSEHDRIRQGKTHYYKLSNVKTTNRSCCSFCVFNNNCHDKLRLEFKNQMDRYCDIDWYFTIIDGEI